MNNQVVKKLLGNLILSAPVKRFEAISVDENTESVYNPIIRIVQGRSSDLIYNNEYDDILHGDNAINILKNYPAEALDTTLSNYVSYLRLSLIDKFGAEMGHFHFHIIGIAFLQTFVQLNFTGPGLDFNQSVFFPGVDALLLQLEAVKLLALEGQTPYDIMVDPVFLVISSLIFENVMQVTLENSLVSSSINLNSDHCSQQIVKFCEENVNEPIAASVCWWRSRNLQIHLSLFSEPPSIFPTLSSLLLGTNTVNALCSSQDNDVELQRYLQLSYFIETARFSIHSQTENLAVPLLADARKVSDLSLVLTGARAKRTKFQTFHTSNLIVLAKSGATDFYEPEINKESMPEAHDLNSDVLLERPHFESLEDVEMPDQPNSKRIKFDPGSTEEESNTEKLLPIAARQEDIPTTLKDIDPNDQPHLNELDYIQLLLRLTTIRQTSPSGNPLVEEELQALVSRILYIDSKSVNWSIFSRALWERSLLETNKAKTIERGILQMTSLVEEMGIKIKTRILPQAVEEQSSDGSGPAASRLRFIHQMTLIPQWNMDMILAEKYMSIGVLRSALEIYERLQMSCEMALCYAAVDNEEEAKRVIIERIQKHPEDARALSILGDITQDPALWEKAWQIGKYHKSKASLSRYYYAPPASSGLEKNVNLAIKHMNDALQINPLSFENWFFYGCCGLETAQYELAAEAFSRCVALDDFNSHAWSNLATALLRQDKTRPAFNALKKALRVANEGKRSWRIFENYMIVAMKLNEWNDVLIAVRELIDIKGQNDGESSIDIPVIEKLVEILVSTEFPPEGTRLSHYQTSCIDLVCNILPKVITGSSRCWRIVARVELWRKKPWIALECHEKAYRAVSGNPDLETDEAIWNESVDACSDLCAAYESLGELPGKHDAGDVVCKDWKYKARQTIRSLLSKGRDMWEDSEGWNRLQDLKQDYV